MDGVNMAAIPALTKYKKLHFSNNLLFYTLTAVACSLMFSGPFWYPSLCSSIKVFLYVTLPKIFSLFFSSKFLFLIGNLIVVILVGEFKIFSSNSPPANDNENAKKRGRLEMSAKDRMGKSYKEGKDMRIESDCEEEEEELSLPAEELSKRADDLIARVNKQRRLEIKLQSVYD